MINDTIRKITLHAQEIRKDKQTFIACSAEINKKWYKIKFTKDCNESPKTKGLYELAIDFDNCSVEKGKQYTNKNGKKGVANDTIWVRDVVALRQYTDAELKAANRAAMSAVFDGEDSAEIATKLPF